MKGGPDSPPLPELAAPSIHRLSLPTRSPWLPEVNAYLVADPRGLLLIDCGVGTPQALDALGAQLGHLGHGLEGIAVIVLTHGHPDHLGLARTLAERSGSRVLVHGEELPFIDGATLPQRRREVARWYRRNGLTETDDVDWRGLPMGHPEPTGTLADGDVIEWGGRRLEVVWTPGHSPGLVCLYDAASRTLISSDHVLERITPHVGLHFDTPRDPLGQYLAALARVGLLDVEVILPGHGAPFGDISGRVAEIEEHHERRCAEIMAAVSAAGSSAFEIAQGLTWVGSAEGWSRLDALNRRSALAETIAHLRLLERTGRLVEQDRDGVLAFRPASQAATA